MNFQVLLPKNYLSHFKICDECAALITKVPLPANSTIHYESNSITYTQKQ